MQFVSAIDIPTVQSGPAFWFIFRDNELLVCRREDGDRVPVFDDISQVGIAMLRQHYLGTLDGYDCFCAESDRESVFPADYYFSPLRPLLNALGEEMFAIAGRAFQIIDWDRNHQFCSRCGSKLVIKRGERAKECLLCELVVYPVIAPAVIVAVVREGTLLMAHSLRFQKGLYSVLAGFVEAGETLEECVLREVLEETGITVTNIEYFGSMPWPFPNSLMVGFTASYASGELAIDRSELDDGGWYRHDSLPRRLPMKGTIARKLIDWFVDSCSVDESEARV